MNYYSRALLAPLHRWSIGLLVFLAATPGLVIAQTNVTQTDHGVVVAIGQAHIEAAAATAGALRLSVSYDGNPQAHRSIFLADSADQPPVHAKVVHEGKLVGVATAAGALLIDPANGDWTLHDGRGRTLIPLSKISEEPKDNQGKPHVAIEVGWQKGKTPAFYGSGNGSVSLLETQGLERVGNGIAVVPHYWSDPVMPFWRLARTTTRRPVGRFRMGRTISPGRSAAHPPISI